MPYHWLQWLDALERCLSPVGAGMTFLHRLIHLTNQCPAVNLLQLAPRSFCSDRGCPVYALKGSLCLHVTAFLPDHAMPGEICLKQATAVLVAPVWQNQSWYSFLLRSLAELPILFPPVQKHPSEPGRSDASISESGPPFSSPMACLRRTFCSEGFSDGVIKLIRKSWCNSTESAYSSAWQMWNS